MTVGRPVKAIVLNNRGFATCRFYLTPRFSANKLVERVVSAIVTAVELNDDTLGWTLDSLHYVNVSELLGLVTQRACRRLGVPTRAGLLDSETFDVDERYNEGNGEGVIRMKPSCGRHHLPELRQAMLELTSESEASLPQMMGPVSGTALDKSIFAKTVT